MAQAQVASAGTDPSGSAYNNLPAAYQQTTQSGLAQVQAASAVNYPYASPNAYFPAAAYEQATQAWPYAYAVPYADANPMACHEAVQASGYAGYPGANYDQNAVPYYPGYPAGYDQTALYYYPVAYAAPQYTVAVNGGPATDAANMDGDAGFPVGQVQTSSGTTAIIEQAPDPPSDGAYHPSHTGEAQM